jgi:hypothetical protein
MVVILDTKARLGNLILDIEARLGCHLALALARHGERLNSPECHGDIKKRAFRVYEKSDK